MESYILLANLEENFRHQTVDALLSEGYATLKKQGSYLIMMNGEITETDEKMAEIMFSMMQRMRIDVPCYEDISNIFNRHKERLEKEKFAGLKFNDSFLWHLRQFLTVLYSFIEFLFK